MEQVLHLAEHFYMQRKEELIIALLVCILILMITALKAAGRNRRRILQLADRIRELTKASFSQMKSTGGESGPQNTGKPAKNNKKETVTEMSAGEEEEIFSSVIREIFP